jgi:ribosomal-protein-alanine N-acetyltransferase
MDIRTPRLLLREFMEDDWQSIHRYRSDEHYQRFYPDMLANEIEIRAFVQRMIDARLQEPRLNYQLVIVLPESGELIGNAGIRQRSLGQREPEARQADIGYELDPQFWGHGYATEAAGAVLRFGFEQLGVHRTWASCLAENTASAQVLEKLGMQREGRLREDEYFKGRWWDTLVYAILDHEWEALQTEAQDVPLKRHSSLPRFRTALPKDAPRLTEIAFAAKRYWGYPEHWIAVWRQQLIITEEYVRTHHVVLAEISAQIAGFYGLISEGARAELDYLWVDPPYIGQGIGRALVDHARHAAASSGAERLEIIADPNAEGFYRRMGAERIGESVYMLEGRERRLPRMVIHLAGAVGG